jgi:hypothetical protein
VKNFYRSYPKKLSSLFTFIFVICLIHSIGSGGVLKPDVSEAGGIPEAVALDKSNPGIQTAIAAQGRHTDILLGEPGIVGTAVGLTEHGKPAILVLATSFNEAKAANIPSNIEGIPVIVKITGKIVAFPKPDSNPGRGGGGGGGSEENNDPTSRFQRPVPIGVSTGHPAITAGTIGARVTDGSNVYALSNNHVYANSNGAGIGDSVIQPGTFDGGSSPADDIGTLSDFGNIDFNGGNNTIDAAIALSSTALLGNATPSNGYGTPKTTIEDNPAVNQKVMKYGRTTGLTKGNIAAINGTVDVNYGGGNIARFVGQIIIQPGSFSAGGDSGSLIVLDGKGRDKANKGKPVGLLFAGSNVYTIANPIDAVLTELGVTIDGD